MNALIEKLKKKDEAALKEVMSMYKKPVCNFLNLMVGNRELAEELTQDTFVKVYFKAHSLKTENLKSWIYTIAVNLARSEFRKRRLKILFSLSDIGEHHVSFTPSYENSIILEQVMTQIPEKYRVPLVMKEVDNFSFEEIAETLQKPLGTVKSLVFRGKKLLRENFPQLAGEQND